MKFENGLKVTVDLFGLGSGQIVDICGNKATVKFDKRPGIDINGGSIHTW